MFADVVLPLPLAGTFTYRIPAELIDSIGTGCLVSVPFGKSKIYTGLVGEVHEESPDVGLTTPLKDIIKMLGACPSIRPSQLQFWQWIASYYLCSLGEVFHAAIPANIKTGVPQRKRHTTIDTIDTNDTIDTAYTATATVLASIQDSFLTKDITLLHSTASANISELLISLIANTLAQNRQVLYLLPEIAVTNALTDRLQSAFGNRLLVYHSAITNAKRAGIWNRLLDPSEEPLVVLGARSSLFLPFARLGLVIVDDEHDTSYKQQDPAPRYHARNAALVLARLHKAKTLLCSATPSLESYVHATNGKYGLVKMPHTATQQPQVEIIDVRDLRRKNRMRGETLFSPQLIEYIRSVLDNGLKVILFQNRRGASDTFTYYGFGSEDIEREVHSLFPAVATVRLDTDTAHTRKAAERLLSDFVGGKASILVGTQLVAKRRNYGGVGLVAVMNLDTILNVQDFRAYERAFDMVFLLSALTDATIPRPKIVLQTAQADNPAFPALRSLDYDAMARSQLAERHAFAYPPYSRLITVILKAKSEQLLDTFAEEYAECLRTVFGDAVSEPSTPTNSTSYSRQSFFVRRIKLKTDITSPVATIRRSLESCYDRMRLTPFAGRIILHYDVDN